MANQRIGKKKNHNPGWNEDVFRGNKRHASKQVFSGPMPMSYFYGDSLVPGKTEPRAAALPLKPPHLLAAAGEEGWKR